MPFEVVGPSTARTDRILKVQEYAAIPTVRSYVRVDDLVLPGMTLSLSDLFEAVTFPEDP